MTITQCKVEGLAELGTENVVGYDGSIKGAATEKVSVWEGDIGHRSSAGTEGSFSDLEENRQVSGCECDGEGSDR